MPGWNLSFGTDSNTILRLDTSGESFYIVCVWFMLGDGQNLIWSTQVCVHTAEWHWHCTHHLRLFNTQPLVKNSEIKTISSNFNLVLTCSWTAAAVWTAGAADVAAAGVWTALAPADPNQEQQQQEAQSHQNNQEPVCVGQQGVHQIHWYQRFTSTIHKTWICSLKKVQFVRIPNSSNTNFLNKISNKLNL